MVLNAKLPLIILPNIYEQRIEMAIRIIKTEVPNAFISTFGYVAKIESYVKTVISWKPIIIRSIEDIHSFIKAIAIGI